MSRGYLRPRRGALNIGYGSWTVIMFVCLAEQKIIAIYMAPHVQHDLKLQNAQLNKY